MFTGLIEATGRIERVEPLASGCRMRIGTPLGGALQPGDSIAVNGVCLTVTAANPGSFLVDLSPETVRVTSFGSAQEGRRVNLERPLRADARLGGHFVLGHVDGVGRVRTIQAQGEHHWIEFEYPAELASCLVSKGSIAVDGISLTVAGLAGERFGVQIVPFTWEHTALEDLQPGDPVNLEADVLGKYVVRLLEAQTAKA